MSQTTLVVTSTGVVCQEGVTVSESVPFVENCFLNEKMELMRQINDLREEVSELKRRVSLLESNGPETYASDEASSYTTAVSIPSSAPPSDDLLGEEALLGLPNGH